MVGIHLGSIPKTGSNVAIRLRTKKKKVFNKWKENVVKMTEKFTAE